MLDFKVVSLYNKLNKVYIDIFQKTNTLQQTNIEFKIRTQISFNTYNYEYVWGLYELSRSVSFHIIYGYEMVYNNLGYDFSYAVHAGDFKAFKPPDELQPIEEHTEERAEEHTEERAEEPIEEREEEHTEERAEEPIEERAEEPTEERAEEPIEERAEEPIEERAEEPIEENTVLEQPLLTRSCSIYY